MVTRLLTDPGVVRIGNAGSELDGLHRRAVLGLIVDAFFDHRVVHHRATYRVRRIIGALYLHLKAISDRVANARY